MAAVGLVVEAKPAQLPAAICQLNVQPVVGRKAWQQAAATAAAVEVRGQFAARSKNLACLLSE
jgi:hypothetical protein